MTPKHAKQRYWKIFIPSMVTFFVTMFIATYLIRNMELPSAANYVLALIPAACICWFMWGHGRWIFETDEYQRLRETRAMMGAAAITLAVSTGWGLLEMLANAPKFPVYYIFVLFCFGYSLTKFLTKPKGEAC